jgi:hypothetical protein
MASLRRNKTLSPDGQTARFLYTIIKQLDLKAIDWNLVAGSLEITNGHAARMRYSRFKQHMEGATTQTRAPRAGKKEKEGKEGKERKGGNEGKEGKEGKGGKSGLKKGKKRAFEDEADDQRMAPPYVKSENGPDSAGPMVKRECHNIRIKKEPDTKSAPPPIHTKTEPSLLQEARPDLFDTHSATKVKREHEPDIAISSSPIDPDIWQILPRASLGNMSLQDPLPLRSTTTITIPSSLSLTAQPQPHQPPQVLRPLYQFAPAQPTVSLAELEVSPRFRAPAVAADGGFPRSGFADRGLLEGRKVLDSGSAASTGGTNVVRVKDEPMLVVADWMVAGVGKGCMVKSEPVEM